MLFVVAVIVLIVVRSQFVPESFGDIGHYRADAIPEITALPVRYAGLPVCAECHDDIEATKSASYHRGLTCEGCHEAAANHVDDPDTYRPEIPTGRSVCLRCHSYLPSRPTGFPQIIEAVHNPMEPCAECHDPHDPTPPEVPSQCSACHAAIARTKAVSHHLSLDCETCHDAPAAHREDPRAHLPTKPTQRAFCGQCHSGGGSGSEIPQVSLADHGGRYLCWQCHYPHNPEGR
jgi:hypothetical protein